MQNYTTGYVYMTPLHDMYRLHEDEYLDEFDEMDYESESNDDALDGYGSEDSLFTRTLIDLNARNPAKPKNYWGNS